MLGVDGTRRCFGGSEGKEAYGVYHDTEWGIPVFEDQKLFEILTLEGAQAGLSFETILLRREGYRAAFAQFDPEKIASFSDQDLETILHNPKVIRHRAKIFSVRQNARVFLTLQKEFGSFSYYAWSFVGGQPQVHRWKTWKEVPAQSTESVALSKDLRKRGMAFVGPTILYAFMQACGMIDDHLMDCPCRSSDRRLCHRHESF
ncbi:MAG: DNA-3-methyladenine glycosylase I [Chlamydiae bacterium]|nr:DNA-3-methyladenine glycosylase I [Chlamydiota bacterium]